VALQDFRSCFEGNPHGADKEIMTPLAKARETWPL